MLLVLWETDHQPVNTIGQRLHLGINTTSPLIKRMEKLGLVCRSASDTDKRQQVIHLTPEGRKLQAEAATIPGCLVEQMQQSGIDLKACQAIMPTLDNIMESLSHQDSNPDSKSE